jgi:hypothetical protein
MQEQGGGVDRRKNGFFIAAFGIDGECEGTDYWDFEKLSSKWLNICEEHLAQHGASFDAPWNGRLSHIQTKFTAASGVALVTLSAYGRLGVSVALASGHSSDAETSVLKMFVNSLRGAQLVNVASQSQEPFQDVLAIKERPVMIVVPWAAPEISEQDHALLRELSIHIAGAFFLNRF